MKLDENQKITLTVGQLKRLIKESADEDFEIEDGVLVRYNGDGGVVVIPEGVVEIGKAAFADCENITRIRLPETLKTIGDEAFRDARWFEDISIPDGVETIGEDAFAGTNIRSAFIPDSVREIGPRAFSRCDYLRSIRLPHRDWRRI